MPTYHGSESLGFLLSQTYRKLTQLVTLRLKAYEITPEQFHVLYRISQHDGLNQKEIALRSAKDQPTTTRILDALMKKGLVQKQASTTDRRAFLVFATAKGKEVVAETAPMEAQAIADAVDGIDPAQVELLKTILSQVKDNMEKLLGE
ncbi:MAG TPA: MarR family transcriptional regulator [Bacilli bacterium]|nr:MarR family transcriptional regulator [Bacilli bacterium]